MEHQLFHIVATSGDAMIIGRNNQLPWPKTSGDLKFFKTTTDGSTVIMGRHTFESIGKKALPGRENIVVSHSNSPVPPEVKLVHSVDEALNSASKEKVFIIGGAQLYEQTIEQVNQIYMTKIPGKYEGDVCYPTIPHYFIKKETKKIPENPTLEVVVYENININKK